MLRDALEELRQTVNGNEVVPLNDDELHEMALLCATELRARLPEYAVRQGDLPLEYADAVRERQVMATAIETAAIHPAEEGT